MNNSGGSAIPRRIRSNATTRNTPTPNATEKISTKLGTEETCSARTCRSGSEIVMMKPRIKPRITIKPSFRVRSILPPTCSPIGVIDSSAPMEKNNIPATTSTAPIRNSTRMLGESAAIVNPRASTISTMGSTALMDSLAFSFAFSFIADWWNLNSCNIVLFFTYTSCSEY